MTRTFVTIALAGLMTATLAAEGFAQTNNNLNTLNRTNTQNTNATRPTNTTATTSTNARAGFDTAPKVAPPVQANTQPKPNPVGQPVRTQGNQLGYKPAAPPLHITAPPSPPVSPANTVARSTTTATAPVVRSTTTATVPAKKP